MTKEIIRYILQFIILVITQVSVFNHICILGVGIPLVFIYLIIKLPITLNVNWVMTIGFILGLTIDIFSNTLGMNALSCTILSVVRQPVLKLYQPRQESSSFTEPSIHTLGLSVFLKYTFTLSVIYCFLFFIIEDASFYAPFKLFLRIIFSSILTFAIMASFEGLASRHR